MLKKNLNIALIIYVTRFRENKGPPVFAVALKYCKIMNIKTLEKVIKLILIFIFFQIELCDFLKILGVFPITARSHFLMFEKLVKELAARGHYVDVVSMYPQKKKIPRYRDFYLGTNLSTISVNNLTYDALGDIEGSSMGQWFKVVGMEPCDLLSHPNMEKILRTKRGTYDVIIIELCVADCYLALGEYLKAPIVGISAIKMPDWLFPRFGIDLNPSYMPSLLSRTSQQMTFWERLQNTITTNFITFQVDYYAQVHIDYVKKYFGRQLRSVKDLYKDVSLILVNEYSSVDHMRPMTPDVIEVGGIHMSEDHEMLTPDLQKWLDESTYGCVYFTLGSMVKFETFPKDVIQMFYEMFEEIAPVRVLTRILDPSALPPGLPKNVKTSSWLPQVAILKHENVKVFITHGGLMSTQEAIAYKVPMVGLPLFADQYTNLGTSVTKKIAIALNLHHLTADALTNAVKTVLTDPTYRNNIEKISKLFLDRPMSAIDTAVYWIEYTARHGTVLKSPATELTWWQFHLLDVYGFILTCLLVALYIIKNIAVWLRKQTIQFRMKYPNNLLKHKKIK